MKGDSAEGLGKLVFVVEQGTAYGLNAATGKVLWRRFVALDPKSPAVTGLSTKTERDEYGKESSHESFDRF